MKTYDVYRLAIEEGKTRFKRKLDGCVYVWDKTATISFLLRPENNLTCWNPVRIDEEWEEAREPVSFTETLKIVDESEGDILWTIKNEEYEEEIEAETLDVILAKLANEHLDTGLANILLNSKWYREN